jgi:hypothetical protein
MIKWSELVWGLQTVTIGESLSKAEQSKAERVALQACDVQPKTVDGLSKIFQ